MDIDLIKNELKKRGIIVHRDMINPADIIDGKPRLAIPRRVENEERFIDGILETGYENFSYFSHYPYIESSIIRFSVW